MLDNLPLELIEKIARGLSVRDLLCCCATSKKLRHSFNVDFIWKRRCNLEAVEYLENTECLLEPSFEWLEVTDNEGLSTLSPLPMWRKRYMMKARLFKNWREGRYFTQEIEFGTSSDFFHHTIVRFCGNDHIFLHTSHICEDREQGEIWHTSSPNSLHSRFSLDFSNIIMNRHFKDISTCKIIGNKLLVSKGVITLIYDFCQTNFSPPSLTSTFLFDLSEEESARVIAQVKSDPELFLTIKRNAILIVCGHFAIGSVTDTTTFHIWDIFTSKKVVEQEVNLVDVITSIVPICCHEESKQVVFKLTLQCTPLSRHFKRYQYLGFNLSLMEFSSFKLRHNYCNLMKITSLCVIGVCSKQLYSFSYETSKKLASRKCNYFILNETLTIVGGHLLCGTSDSTIFVMDPISLVVINSVKLGFTLYSLMPLCDRFVMINSIGTEIWEIGKSAQLMFRISYDGSYAAVNEYCSKLVVKKNNKIIILHFW